MNTPETPGQMMHDEEAEARRLGASLMGRARTERKTAAARTTAAKRRGVPLSEEHKAKIRAAKSAQQDKISEAQKARREREKEAKIAAGLLSAEPTEKRKPGRPKTKPEADANAPKRPVGRPKKQASPNASAESETPQNGA